MTDCSLYILHTNNLPLLRAAARSVRMLDSVVVIDNSDKGLQLTTDVAKDLADCIILRPPVSLTAPQSFNWAYRHSKALGHNFCLTMHEDAESQEDAAMQLVTLCRLYNADRPDWGVVFTNYDAIAAYNLSMVSQVGEWDQNFHHYFSDNDYFRRVRLGGWETLESSLPVIHHGSQTIKKDPYRRLVNEVLFPSDGRYYEAKWGGKPGEERFQTAFNQ